jgi:hemoglobin
MKDIETFEECTFLIEHFYDKLLADDLIGHYFKSLDLSKHLPRVAEFWAFILLDKTGYTGNMMEAHARLPLKEPDFDRWLALFHTTVHEHFSGEKANLAVERSSLIAWTMKSKLS